MDKKQMMDLVNIASSDLINQLRGQTDFKTDLIIDVITDKKWTENTSFCMSAISVARDHFQEVYESANEMVIDCKSGDENFEDICSMTAHYILYLMVGDQVELLLKESKQKIAKLGFTDISTGGGCVGHCIDLNDGMRILMTDGDCGYVFNPQAQVYIGLDNNDCETIAYFYCDNLDEALTIAKTLKKTYGA
jgi:hypothetical protein